MSTIPPNLSQMLLTSSKINFISIPSLECPLQEILMRNELFFCGDSQKNKSTA